MKEKQIHLVDGKDFVELKPCPFCGSTEWSMDSPLQIDDKDNGRFETFIHCRKCKLTMTEEWSARYAAMDELIKRWNHRV